MIAIQTIDVIKVIIFPILMMSSFSAIGQVKDTIYLINKADSIFGKIEFKVKHKNITCDGILVRREVAKINGRHIGHQKRWVESYIKTNTGYIQIKTSYMFVPTCR